MSICKQALSRRISITGTATDATPLPTSGLEILLICWGNRHEMLQAYYVRETISA
ncbi:Hypothetical predicted protein [Podarcis lilfordi]|uniref:Uncharacterized protein n=1 Tax=Podarcis lilfordi TaxID=74358 RepID=A0AA35KL04_9SAUR|nr:Hypothetical predicted protein [Podarcis lilfordi]